MSTLPEIIMKKESSQLLWKFLITLLVCWFLCPSIGFCFFVSFSTTLTNFRLWYFLSGVAQGTLVSTAEAVFQYLAPVLSEFSTLIGLYHNYQDVVELILELHVESAGRILSALNPVCVLIGF